MFKKISQPFLGFLQASGLVGYIILVSTFFNYAPKIVSEDSEEFVAPIIMLLLFILSAVISALITLGRSVFLFWEKRYRESFTLIAWTVGWGIFYLALFITILYCYNN